MKQILVLFASLILFNLNASESPYLINVNIDTKVMALDLSKIVGKNVTVTINDINGNEIFTEVIMVKAKSRLYNLKNLKSGTYTVIVENENQITFQKVYVSNNSLLASDEVEELTKPMINIVGTSLVVSTTNNKIASNVSISDENGNRVYSEVSKVYPAVKSFNISKLEKGAYDVHYTAKGKTFTQTVSIK